MILMPQQSFFTLFMIIKHFDKKVEGPQKISFYPGSLPNFLVVGSLLFKLYYSLNHCVMLLVWEPFIVLPWKC